MSRANKYVANYAIDDKRREVRVANGTLPSLPTIAAITKIDFGAMCASAFRLRGGWR
jgi:hypothetical protein